MKTQILEKIETLFWENAFAEVSMDEVAKRLDMKKASLYYHFPSKELMFIEVLEYSFEKYKNHMGDLFVKLNISEILMDMIEYPVNSKNLFAVVSQKGYCKMDSVINLIVIKNKELFQIFNDHFGDKYKFNTEKTILLQTLLNDLSKKYCIFDCKETLDLNKLIPEIIKIFF